MARPAAKLGYTSRVISEHEVAMPHCSPAAKLLGDHRAGRFQSTARRRGTRRGRSLPCPRDFMLQEHLVCLCAGAENLLAGLTAEFKANTAL